MEKEDFNLNLIALGDEDVNKSNIINSYINGKKLNLMNNSLIGINSQKKNKHK